MTDIVVGVDGSVGAANAVRWAVSEAGVRGQPLTAVMAWEPGDLRLAPAVDARHSGEGRARALLDQYVVGAVGEAAAVNIRRRVVCQPAARALADSSIGASLLVVGARGLGGVRGLLLGSVSERCLHDAACPVAIIRTEAEPAGGSPWRRIVVGVDGSEPARRAIQWAAREARLHGAALEAVHAWSMPYGFGFPYTSAGLDPSWIEEGARATLDAAVDALDATELAQPVERILAVGGAAAAILDAAKGADLVVLGSRGLGGFTGLVLGSVSHQVAHHATTPVVIVPSAP